MIPANWAFSVITLDKKLILRSSWKSHLPFWMKSSGLQLWLGIIGLHKTFNEHCDCWWPSTVRCLDICRYTDDNFQSLIYRASALEWLRYNLLKSNTSHTLWSHYLSHCRLYPLLGCTHGKNSFWYRVTSHSLSVNKYGILILLTTHAHICWMENGLN